MKGEFKESTSDIRQCRYYRKRGSASYIVRQWLLWEGERERERERERDACDVIDITLKSRVIMHMITSTALRPNASTRSEPVERSNFEVHVKTRSVALERSIEQQGRVIREVKRTCETRRVRFRWRVRERVWRWSRSDRVRHSSRRVRGLWLARPIESVFPQNFFFFFFFDSVGLWTASTSDGVVGLCSFRQRGIWTLDSVDFATAWTFSVEMSGSSCASGATGPDHYSVFLLFHFPFEENHQIKITANPENEIYGCPYDHHLDSADLQLHVVCLWIREGVYAPFFWRHTRQRLVTSGLTSFLLVTSASRVASVWLVLVSFRVFS